MQLDNLTIVVIGHAVQGVPQHLGVIIQVAALLLAINVDVQDPE
jgi:hypothetical protein